MNFKKNFKRFFTLSRNAEGFTLVELIVVIAILGILAVVAVPTYTDYVERSEKAVDNSQIGVLNSVFSVACVSNGVEPSYFADGTVTLTWTGKAVTGVDVPGVTKTATADSIESRIEADFTTYAGTAGIPFKIYTSSDITFKDGGFVGPNGETGGEGGSSSAQIPDAFKDVPGRINSTDKDTFNNSYFGTSIGAEEVMGQVDFVTELAGGLFTDGNSPELQLMMVTGLQNLGQYAPEGMDAFAYSKTLIRQKMAQMNPTWTEEQLDAAMDSEGDAYQAASAQVTANAAVLNAAKNAGTADYDTMTGLLVKVEGGNTPTKNLLDAVSADPSTALAQVSATYGLYYAFAERNGLTVSDQPGQVLTDLESAEFQAYLQTQNAKDDLAGYTAAMNMVNSGISDKASVEQVVLNGFDDPGLKALMQQILGASN